MPLNQLTIFYSLLFLPSDILYLRNDRIEFKFGERWLSVLNKVRSLFRLNDIQDERGREIIEEAFSNFPRFLHADQENYPDLLSGIFWCFYRQTKITTGLLDFILDNANIKTILTFCRTHDYKVIPTERCIRLPEDYTEKFVDKLGHRILTHPTVEDQSIHEMLSRKCKLSLCRYLNHLHGYQSSVLVFKD